MRYMRSKSPIFLDSLNTIYQPSTFCPRLETTPFLMRKATGQLPCWELSRWNAIILDHKLRKCVGDVLIASITGRQRCFYSRLVPRVILHKKYHQPRVENSKRIGGATWVSMTSAFLWERMRFFTHCSTRQLASPFPRRKEVVSSLLCPASPQCDWATYLLVNEGSYIWAAHDI